MPAPRFADSHAHLEDAAFDADRRDVVARAAAVGVDTLVLVGLDVDSSRRCLARAATLEGAVATAGIHPHEVESAGDAARDEVAAMLRGGGFHGVGETGLDRVRSRTSPESQRDSLAAHVGLARELGLPIVLHCREAFDELFDVLRMEGRGSVEGVLHCFTGGPDEARRAVDLGLHVSFSGIVTFSGADGIRTAVPVVPLDRLLVETDCPYLAPVPHRGRRNEPAYVAATAEVVAGLRGGEREGVYAALHANARRLFRVPGA